MEQVQDSTTQTTFTTYTALILVVLALIVARFSYLQQASKIIPMLPGQQVRLDKEVLKDGLIVPVLFNQGVVQVEELEPILFMLDNHDLQAEVLLQPESQAVGLDELLVRQEQLIGFLAQRNFSPDTIKVALVQQPATFQAKVMLTERGLLK